ncbi:TetR/AcrR family transcriptional regulator [Thermomonospora umbrina]|uniref:TetR family transcriptional regulator n=1 Tax=Thermomonospora umbrina TaxID=111806 RepID=A0A3D9T7N4_9ACTN|nr:TetR/AcrR family transcriptional regulator [Thermomonospora umbrina]REF00685.1 TetR family transcriptional regulator [Thermomonospora umbrina]
MDSTVELLWGVRPSPSRGPRPAFTIEDIAKAAMDIADAEGLTALSMQRVAGELGFTKMALYRYVRGKAELIAVMIEEAVGEPPDLSAVPGGWRGRLQHWAQHLWETWDRHPWLPGATTGERVMGPKEIGWTEIAVAALVGTGLSGSEQMDAVLLLSGHVRNTRSTASAGTQPWTTQRQPDLSTLPDHAADRFPALSAAIASAADPTPDRSREFGLQRLLDGLEVLITQRTR